MRGVEVGVCRLARPRGRGVALVLVLWVIVLLTVIAVSLVSTQRTELSMTLINREQRHGRALLDAGTEFMIWQLLQARGRGTQKGKWPTDGWLRQWAFAGRQIRVSAVPEVARIDLNAASPELLVGLFESAGLSKQDAVRIKDAILDWRDPDSNHRLNGAEDPDYRTAGLPYGAGDRDFTDIGELRMVLGVTSQLFDSVAPALTVHSRENKVNPVFAPQRVLRAIPGMTPDQVAAYLELRKRSHEQGVPVPFPNSVNQRVLGRSTPSTYRVYAETDLPGGGRARGYVVVTIGGGDKGYVILERSYIPWADSAQTKQQAD